MAINTDPNIHNVVICANIFVRKDGKYLMLRRSPLKKVLPNYLHPIGGKVDPNEDPFTAAQREVMEEAGIKVKNMRLEAVLTEDLSADNRENWIIFHFSADYESGEIIDTEEGTLEWHTPEEIKNDKLFSSVKEIINEILDPGHGTVFAKNIFKGEEILDRVKNVCIV